MTFVGTGIDERGTAASLRIGIDLGGTKIEAIAIDGRGTQRARLRRPTPQGD